MDILYIAFIIFYSQLNATFNIFIIFGILMARNPGSIYLSFVFFTWIMILGMISANGNYIKGMFNFFGRSNPPAQVSKVTTNLNTTKIGIMLLNLGGPAKIEVFLFI